MANPMRNHDEDDNEVAVMMAAARHNACQIADITKMTSPNPQAAVLTLQLALAAMMLAHKRPDVSVADMIDQWVPAFSSLVTGMATAREMDRQNEAEKRAVDVPLFAFPNNGSVN